MAKLPSGVLNVNINWLGNWKLCNSVLNNNSTPPMKAKYCRATIGGPINEFAVKIKLFIVEKIIHCDI